VSGWIELKTDGKDKPQMIQVISGQRV